MSFSVLVIAEYPKHNGIILKPLVSAILSDVGKPRSTVHVADRPRTRGYANALRLIRHEFPQSYRHYDLWLFFPDADRASPDAMRRLESDLDILNIPLICSPSEPEVEIYACFGFRRSIKLNWEELRIHPRLKEDVFHPLLRQPAFRDLPHSVRDSRGRARMIRESLRNRQLLFKMCPELTLLRDRIASHISGDG